MIAITSLQHSPGGVNQASTRGDVYLRHADTPHNLASTGPSMIRNRRRINKLGFGFDSYTPSTTNPSLTQFSPNRYTTGNTQPFKQLSDNSWGQRYATPALSNVERHYPSDWMRFGLNLGMAGGALAGAVTAITRRMPLLKGILNTVGLGALGALAGVFAGTTMRRN